MISQNLKEKIKGLVKQLQHYSNRWWYSPLIAFLAGLDNLIVIIPTDGILISSTMLRPKKWLLYAFFISFGSTLGGMILAALVQSHGLPWILQFYPTITTSQSWILTESFFTKYGLLLVFIIAATPLTQQPTVILAALAHTPLEKIAITVFAGRFLKYIVMGYIASHAPKLLTKLWGLQEELEEVGISKKT